MNILLRCWKKLLYLLITGSTSVFIAACYGLPAGFAHLGTWTIKVKDSNNEPIRGLEIAVLQFAQGGTVPDTLETQTTDSTGSALFYLTTYNQNVSHMHEARLRDIDGLENGGQFSDTSIIKTGEDETVVILNRQQ